MALPREDIHVAHRSGRITFSVATKDRKGAPWADHVAGIRDLRAAFADARATTGDVYESGVFVHFEQSGGFLYWTSIAPEVFNSSVLRLQPEG